MLEGILQMQLEVMGFPLWYKIQANNLLSKFLLQTKMLYYGNAVEIIKIVLQWLHDVSLGEMGIKGPYRIFIKSIGIWTLVNQINAKKASCRFYISNMLIIMVLMFYIYKLEVENNFIIIYRIQKIVGGKRKDQKMKRRIGIHYLFICLQWQIQQTGIKFIPNLYFVGMVNAFNAH